MTLGRAVGAARGLGVGKPIQSTSRHPASPPLVPPMLSCAHAQSLQSWPTLCNPMECSPLGPCVHGILQARIMEWAAMPSSRRSSQLRDGNHVSYVSCIGRQDFFLPLELPGKLNNGPYLIFIIIFPLSDKNQTTYSPLRK